MKVSSYLFLLAGVALFLNQGCSPKLAVSDSRWQASPLAVDGAGDDWTKLPRFYDSETKLSYDVSNDDQNLYVIMKAVDGDLKAKILRGGFNVWIDTSWQKKTTMGVRFPLPPTERSVQYQPTDQQDNSGQERTQRQGKDMARNFTKNLQEMDLVALANGKSARTTTQNSYGVVAAISLDREGTMFYELKIPLRAIFKDTVTMPLVKRKVTVGLVANKPEAKPSNAPMKNGDTEDFGRRGTGNVGGNDVMQTGSDPGRTGRMGSGGGMGGGMPRSSNNNWGNEEKQVNIWMTVQLVPVSTQ